MEALLSSSKEGKMMTLTDRFPYQLAWDILHTELLESRRPLLVMIIE